jgi:hypothetical protein
VALKQRVTAAVVRQFGHPRGIAGRAAGWIMAHPSSNRQRNQLPSLDVPLDAILAVDSVGFWPNAASQLRDLRNLFRPGGRIALTTQPRRLGATKDTTARAARALQDLLNQAGLIDTRVHTLNLDRPVACVLATNPPNGPPQAGARRQGRGTPDEPLR